MIDVVNLQRKVKLDIDAFKRFALEAAKAETEADGAFAAVAFVSDERMTTLNSTFRGKESTTDVLSFPSEPDGVNPTEGHLGDIVISAEQAVRQADENGLSLEVEIKQLILHGMLHLVGHDHETDDGEMDAREIELRGRLGI